MTVADILDSSTFLHEGMVDSVYSPLGTTPYRQVLPQVQAAVALNLKRQVDELHEPELKSIILKYLRDNQVKCDLTSDTQELVNHIYHDMAGMSFISRENIFDMEGFEELDINAWNDVEIIIKGKRRKTEYQFLSPTHAQDILLRILRRTETPFDIATPRATADIQNGIRIQAWRTPLLDEDVAAAASIRKVDMSVLTRWQLTRGCLLDEMMTLLETCLTNGVSICFSGETGAGKTSLAGYLLGYAAQRLRVITIEEGSREWNFVTRDETGKATNSVIHTKTRPNEKDPTLDISQEELIKDALRFNPDVIAPGEIRGREAFETMGVSNTGHTVITTAHSNGTEDTPERVVTLAKKAYDMSDSTLFSMFARAFPILVHIEKCADGERRVTEIREVIGYQQGELRSQLLYEFDVRDNIYDDNEVCIRTEGEFRRLAPISEPLRKRLLKKGARRSVLEPFMKEVGGGA